jgi:hypothetical protein
MSAQDLRRFHHEVSAATWANEAEAEYANHTYQQKAEGGHPKVISEPRAGSPAPGQYADSHQPDEKKSVPSAQFVSDGQAEARISDNA